MDGYERETQFMSCHLHDAEFDSTSLIDSPLSVERPNHPKLRDKSLR